jgi:hypothetical protein
MEEETACEVGVGGERNSEIHDARIRPDGAGFGNCFTDFFLKSDWDWPGYGRVYGNISSVQNFMV